jgi:hypothetical protein
MPPRVGGERRRHPRFAVSFLLRVQGYEADRLILDEVTTTRDASGGSMSFVVERPLAIGQLVRLQLLPPFPRYLGLSFNEPSEPVYATVRSLSIQAGARRVGVLLFGEDEASRDGAGEPEDRRRWARLELGVQFVARQVDEWENSLQEGLGVADNIGRGGALLVTSLPLRQGDVMLLEEIGGGFATRAEVVHGVCREDGTRLLNVRFLDGRSPDALLGSE